MKKYLYLLLAAFTISNTVSAAPGDTTWVQAQTARQMTGYGNYDSTITFPAAGTSYRNIYMIFTLGKYMCPGYNPANPGDGPTHTGWCGDWDYDIHNFLMTPGGDTLELGRLITPYANSLAPRTPWTWTQRYVYDVTDYVSKLQGSATMRVFLSGYSGGWTADVKFAFVEGTPDRDVKEIKRLYYGSYQYGGTTDINTHFAAVSTTAPSGTANAEVKFLVTGHGSDASGCCEFLTKNYDVLLNGSSVASKAIWRSDCGANQLYPQSGTWLYERGNWCPGAMVYPNRHVLPGVSASVPYSVGLQFEAYTGSGSLGSYNTEAHLISYGAINKTLDAGIDNIIAPSNNENQFRSNPICGRPTIHVKNHGATAITSMAIQYGIQDSTMYTYNWTGTLNSLEETDIMLSELPHLNSVTGNTGIYTFVAKITAVNGAADADATNDKMTSPFVAAPRWDNQFKILFRTNNELDGSGVSETSWKITDMSGGVMAQRTGGASNTAYLDTVTLVPGCYKFEMTDGGCDGLQWWAFPAGTSAGSLYIRKMNNANIALNGYNYSGTYANDFGCSFSQYFYAGVPPAVGVTDLADVQVIMETYPNPAHDLVNVDISGLQQVEGTIQIMDIMGRVVATTPCNAAHQQVSTANIGSGIYTVVFITDNGNKLQSRLMIAK